MYGKSTKIKLCILYSSAILVFIPGLGPFLAKCFWRWFRKQDPQIDLPGKHIVNFQAENILLMVLVVILWALLPRFIHVKFISYNSIELMEFSLLGLLIYNWYYSLKGIYCTWSGKRFTLPPTWNLTE